MKKWYFIIPLVLLLSPLLMIFYISAPYGYDFGESVAVLQAVGREHTKYQTLAFSESRFRQIETGMTGKQVYDMVGVPLERHDNDTKWAYSLPVNGAKYYHERTVLLDKGKVTGVICRFHQPESK